MRIETKCKLKEIEQEIVNISKRLERSLDTLTDDITVKAVVGVYCQNFKVTSQRIGIAIEADEFQIAKESI